MDENKSNNPLKKAREKLGISQTEMAELLGYSRQQSVSEIETGKIPKWLKRAIILDEMLSTGGLRIKDLPDDVASKEE